jgi:hypothetical protein
VRRFAARLRRWLLTRCARCEKPFGWSETPVAVPPVVPEPWYRGETGLYHQGCLLRPTVVGWDRVSRMRLD